MKTLRLLLAIFFLFTGPSYAGPTGGTISNIKSLTSTAAIAVGNVSATAHTVPAGRKYVVFQNNGTSNVWMGDSNVDPGNSRGFKIFPGAAFDFKEVEVTFQAYFLCAATESSTISIIEG